MKPLFFRFHFPQFKSQNLSTRQINAPQSIELVPSTIEFYENGNLSHSVGAELADSNSLPCSNRDEDESQWTDTIGGEKQPRWFHFYLHLDCTDTEKYLRITLRGRLTSSKTGAEFWWHRTEDTSEVTEKLIETYIKDLNGFGAADDADKNSGKDANKPKPLKIKVQFRSSIANCDHLPDEKSLVQGRIIVVHTYYLPDFLSVLKEIDRSEDRLACENDGLRIVREYNRKGFRIKSGNFQDISEREGQTIIDCDKFGIFRYRMHHYVQDSKPTEEVNQHWINSKVYCYRRGANGSSFYLRLNNQNIIEVREELLISDVAKRDKKKKYSAEQLFKFLLGYRYSETDSTSEQPKPDWMDGRQPNSVVDIVNEFVAAVVQASEKNIRDPAIQESKAIVELRVKFSSEGKQKRIRQRYLMVLLHNIICLKTHPWGGTGSIKPKKFGRSKLAGKLLQGSFFFEEDATCKTIPRVKKSKNELSTWPEQDVCLIGVDRCVIYHRVGTLLHTRRTPANYTYYWYCFARALQHAVSLRTLIHVLEKAVDLDLFDLSGLQNDNETETNKQTVDQKLSLLRRRVDLVHQFLPAARSVAIPTSTFRSPHAVDKFEYLYNKLYQFPSVFRNIEAGLVAVSSEIDFRQQKTLEQLEKNKQIHIAVVGLLLAGLATFLGWPQFVGSLQICQGNQDHVLAKMCSTPQRYIFFTSTIYWLVISCFHLIGIKIYLVLVERKKGRESLKWLLKRQMLLLGVLATPVILTLFLGYFTLAVSYPEFNLPLFGLPESWPMK